MLFNSFEFALFLPIVFIIYWVIGSNNIKTQNLLILVSSYVFYAFWDWRFLFLIFLSSIIDYYLSLKIDRSQNFNYRKRLLISSIVWNIGILFVFKYFNFFIENFAELFGINYSNTSFSTLHIILPVGLSFYTFQTISYTVDVYRGKIKPTKKIIEFLSFVSFFPQLVAGPIERASKLLPQFFKARQFNALNFNNGLRQILWGVFKKIVIADNLAIAVNLYFNNPQDYQSLELFFALILFYFQIYCDFSGYVDIAIGTAKLFGFNLSANFNLPHFSKSIPEFWRKWNITLSTWFRDYIYVPMLKGSKKSFLQISFGLLFTFILIGFWHGANWTFIVFGAINGIYMIIYRYIPKINKRQLEKYNVTILYSFVSICISFCLTVLAIVFFRAESINVAVDILSRIFSFLPDQDFQTIIGLKILFLPLIVILEIVGRNKEFLLLNLQEVAGRPIRWLIYYIFIFLIIRYGGPQESFIYFQF